LIIGGPPCQDFSHAGQRVEGEKARLTVSFAKIVCAIQPKYFVMENVDRVNKSKAYKEARKLLKEADYGLTEKTLNASYYGVPQNRKRFFSIGALNEKDGFLEGYLSAGQAEFPLTVYDYLGNKLNIEYYYRHPRTYDRRAIFSIYEPAPTIRGSNRQIPPNYKRHPRDVIDPADGIRALTFKERALLQSFPEDYNWLEFSPAINNEMIGNAVPVKLAEYVANCLVTYSKKLNELQKPGFIDWLRKEKKYTSRAAGNTLSRIRRIKRMASLCKNTQSAEINLIGVIESADCFNKLTVSVKSQLRRAYVLYCEYNAIRA
jgi:DNA (cytosine-5)-methyltransferase 1